MHVPRYLGLDIAQKTGWAIVEGDRLVSSGVRDFSIKASQFKGERGIAFHNWLIQTHRDFGPFTEIYYEKVMFGGAFQSKDNHELYHGFLMLMEMFCASFRIQSFGMHPSTLKKEFAGHGRAQKEDMCRVAHEKGWKGGMVGTSIHHDEVDAIALVDCQLRLRHGISLQF